MENIKLLVTTDFHASKSALAGLDKQLSNTKYDAVIMAGDLINPDERELIYVHQFIDLVTNQHRLPLFGLHGNNEPEGAWRYYRESGINIHLENKQFAGYNICGIGGLGYLNEPGFEDLSIENLVINEQTIFVTHVPPKTTDQQLEHGPLVHISGHKHALAFSKQVGPTLQVQCPAGILGRATEIELPKKTVRFIELPT